MFTALVQMTQLILLDLSLLLVCSDMSFCFPMQYSVHKQLGATTFWTVNLKAIKKRILFSFNLSQCKEQNLGKFYLELGTPSSI